MDKPEDLFWDTEPTAEEQAYDEAMVEVFEFLIPEGMPTFMVPYEQWRDAAWCDEPRREQALWN